jgi:exodeoxyribonuclease VII large subunit
MVASARDEMCARIAGLGEDIRKAIRYHLLALRRNLSELESSRAFPEVESRIRGFAQRVDDAGYSMETALRATLKLRRARHSALELRLSESDLRRRVIERRGKLTALSGRLQSSARVGLEMRSERVSLAAGKLDSLSPLGVLARGYAIAFDSERRVIKRASDVASGQQVHVRVSDGEMDCTKK